MAKMKHHNAKYFRIWNLTPFYGHRIIRTAVILLLIALVSGCAYFNTFYNARQYFESAEKTRLQNAGDRVPANALDGYNKVIRKCRIVLEKYPDSRYVDEARFLMGQARFHRGEYRLAEITFNELLNTEESDYRYEAQYWLALIEWKYGKIQPALDDLTRLIEIVSDKQTAAKIHLAIADIYLGINESNQAIRHLREAADLSPSKEARNEIYYRLAELEYKLGNIDAAINANQNVIKNSVAKSRIMEANLEIVKLIRRGGELRSAQNRIRDLLNDERYNSIDPELNLELAKVRMDRGNIEEGLAQLQFVTEEFAKSEVAAEAFYLMGKHAVFVDHDYAAALDYFTLSTKENRKSEYFDISLERKKQLVTFQTAQQELDTLKLELHPVVIDSQEAVDSLAVDSLELTDSLASADSVEPGESLETPLQASIAPRSIADIQNDIADRLYTLGNLEIFQFQHPDTGIALLDSIIVHYPGVELRPRAMFIKGHLLRSRGDSLGARQLDDQLLVEYPETEYAETIRHRRGLLSPEDKRLRELHDLEVLYSLNPDSAVVQYKTFVAADSLNGVTARALFFLAHHYDKRVAEADSAQKYYQLLTARFPDSEQAKQAKSRLRTLETMLSKTEVETEEELPRNPASSAETDSLGNPISPAASAQDSLEMDQDSLEVVPDTLSVSHGDSL